MRLPPILKVGAFRNKRSVALLNLLAEGAQHGSQGIDFIIHLLHRLSCRGVLDVGDCVFSLVSFWVIARHTIR